MTTYDTPTDVMVHFALTSLKNLKVLWDTQAQQSSLADWQDANRRVMDETLDAVSLTISAWHKALRQQQNLDAWRAGMVAALEGTQHILDVAAEEAERTHVIRTRARLADAELAFVKKQIELSFDTLDALEDLRQKAKPKPTTPIARPGAITRVDIDAEAYAHAGSGDRPQSPVTH